MRPTPGLIVNARVAAQLILVSEGVGYAQIIGCVGDERIEHAVFRRLLGARLPFALIVGYSLHGLWDLLHELQAHGAYSAFKPGQLTAIPLAYGVFCAAFDFCMAAYFYARRAEWIAARKAVPQ